jgi:hypothetical protein
MKLQLLLFKLENKALFSSRNGFPFFSRQLFLQLEVFCSETFTKRILFRCQNRFRHLYSLIAFMAAPMAEGEFLMIFFAIRCRIRAYCGTT